MANVTFLEGDTEVVVLPGPYAPDGSPTPEARAFAWELLNRMDELRQFAAKQYHPIYNDTWRDETEPQLSEQEFVAKLGKPSVVLSDEVGSATVTFSPA